MRLLRLDGGLPPVLADRLALSLINRRQVAGKDFRRLENDACLMDDALRKAVLVVYQERKREELRHPFLGKPTTVGMLWHLQAQLLARHLRGDLDGYRRSSGRSEGGAMLVLVSYDVSRPPGRDPVAGGEVGEVRLVLVMVSGCGRGDASLRLVQDFGWPEDDGRGVADGEPVAAEPPRRGRGHPPGSRSKASVA